MLLCPSILCRVSGFMPASMARVAKVSRKACELKWSTIVPEAASLSSIRIIVIFRVLGVIKLPSRDGVHILTEKLGRELSETMKMCGCASLSDIDDDKIW